MTDHLESLGSQEMGSSMKATYKTSTAHELAHRILQLEEQLEAYQSLFEEELDQMRDNLRRCRKDLLKLLEEPNLHVALELTPALEEEAKYLDKS